MTDVFSANASGRPKKRRWASSIGIRGRLFGAFAAVTSLTVFASLVAFISYQWVGDSFRRTEQESIPAMVEALSFSRQAAEFSAMIPNPWRRDSDGDSRITLGLIQRGERRSSPWPFRFGLILTRRR